MLQITNFVMKFAPLGVFAAIAAVITTQGLGVLVTYGKFIATFYFSLAVLWSVLVLVGLVALGRPVLHLIGLLRQPMLLALDDVHWADAASVEVLTHLLRRFHGPLLTAVAYRQPPARLRSALEAAARSGFGTG